MESNTICAVLDIRWPLFMQVIELVKYSVPISSFQKCLRNIRILHLQKCLHSHIVAECIPPEKSGISLLFSVYAQRRSWNARYSSRRNFEKYRDWSYKSFDMDSHIASANKARRRKIILMNILSTRNSLLLRNFKQYDCTSKLCAGVQWGWKQEASKVWCRATAMLVFRAKVMNS